MEQAERVYGMYAIDRETLQSLLGILDQIGYTGSEDDVLGRFYARCERTFMGTGTAERLPEVLTVKET